MCYSGDVMYMHAACDGWAPHIQVEHNYSYRSGIHGATEHILINDNM